MPKDLYDLLGVRRDADQDAIKRAFRSRSRKLHPDVSPDPEAHAKFRELSAAYDVLSHPESRRLYDRFGWRGRGRGFERRRPRVYTASPRGFIQDLEALIAAAAGQPTERRPTEVVGSLELDAYEAHIGATRTVELSTSTPCSACRGSGRRRVVSDRDAGRFVSLEDCLECAGSGVAGATEEVAVPVPPRVRDLDRVTVGPEQVAIVKIVPVVERVAVRAAAFAALLAALGFLLFLLSL
jgi:molecular chaperone DnaJ